MNILTNLKKQAEKIPEFSVSNYSIASYVVASLITFSGLFLIYSVLFKGDLTFSANWNMFKSPLGSLCWGIGFLCAIIFWGKMGHWSRTPVTEYRDSSGNVVGREENYDVMEQGFAKILMPILGHFVLEPIIYGAIIYYPIQCVIALVGAIFPYVLSLIVAAIIAAAWLLPKKLEFRYRSLVLVLAGLLFTAAFAWGGYAIFNTAPGGTIQMLADTNGYSKGSQTTDTQAESAESAEAEAAAADAEEGIAEAEYVDDDVDEQFEYFGEEGLLGSLPIGKTVLAGDMDGFPIELTITKEDNSGDVKAVYKNVKYDTTMTLDGESLPAMGGDINFYGNDGGTSWTYSLTGTIDHVSGTAQGDGKEMKVTLSKK